MNISRKLCLLLFLVLMVPLSAYPLSLQEVQFASASSFTVTSNTKWFDTRHFTSIDFAVTTAAGDGTMIVEYASDSLGASAVEDAIGSTFNVTDTEARKLFGTGITSSFTRLKLTCVTSPCTVSGWFTAKGSRK